MNYYERHIGDYIKDTAHLSLLEHGVYTRLLDVYYLREQGIPKDQAYRLVSAVSKAEKVAVDSVLGEFFKLNGEHWVQGRCQDVIAKYHAFVDKQSAAGKASAVKRALNTGSTTVQPPLNSGCNLIQPPTPHSPLPTTQSRTKNPTAAAPPPEDWFLGFKAVYPQRAGDQGWPKALRAAHARIAEGHLPSEFLDGAERYAAYCLATASTGSAYVKQAATFLGPDKPFLLPWTPPPSKAQLAQDANVATSLEWLEKTNAPN